MADQPKRPKIGSLRLILPYLAAYRGRVVGAVVALLTSVLLVLAVGQGLRRLVDMGFAQGSAAHLNGTALLMFGIVACLAVSSSLRFYLVTWLGERIAADLRRDLFQRVLTLSPAYFEAARRLKGEDIPLVVPSASRSILNRLFGRKAA